LSLARASSGIKAAIDKLPWIDPAIFVAMPDSQQQAGPRAGNYKQ
jgi:hypothetical protein